MADSEDFEKKNRFHTETSTKKTSVAEVSPPNIEFGCNQVKQMDCFDLTASFSRPCMDIALGLAQVRVCVRVCASTLEKVTVNVLPRRRQRVWSKSTHTPLPCGDLCLSGLLRAQ